MHWYSAVKPGEQGFTDKDKVTGQALHYLRRYIADELRLTLKETEKFNKILKKSGYQICLDGRAIRL